MTGDFALGVMRREDIPQLVSIEKACFAHPWTNEGFEAELDNVGANFITVEVGGIIVGYIGFHAVLDEGYVDNIAVLPEYRRRGIAAALMERAFKRCGELKLSFLSLEVRKSNLAAISLYEKYGFETVGERRRFYTAPTEDALIMTVYFDNKRV